MQQTCLVSTVINHTGRQCPPSLVLVGPQTAEEGNRCGTHARICTHCSDEDQWKWYQEDKKMGNLTAMVSLLDRAPPGKAI